MGVHAETVTADQGNLRATHLTVCSRMTQLSNRLDHVQHAAAVTFREESAAGVDREIARWPDSATFDKRAGLTLGAESIVLQLHEDNNRKAVVQ